MKYAQIYDRLIARAQARIIDGYVEKHHITPRCMGGTDESSNIAILTAREHFIAHQLLVKIHPDHPGLVKAVNMMCTVSGTHVRVNNRRYEWLRIRLAEVMSRSQSSEGNSQYGKMWIRHLEQQQVMKILKDDYCLYEALGWSKGRSLNVAFCATCGCAIQHDHKYCKTHRKQAVKDNNAKSSVFCGREQEFFDYYDNLGSMNKACKAMGFPGAISHWYKGAKRLIDSRK